MDPEPAWDAAMRHLGSPEHLHAVGAFALAYNELESDLYIFFLHFFPDNDEVRTHLFTSLHNRERVDLIKLYAAKLEDGLCNAILHAMKCFDICAENRNLLLHAAPMLVDDAGTLVVGKASAGKPGIILAYGFAVEDLRAAALAVSQLSDHIQDINSYIVFSDPTRREDDEPPPTLPERPPLPRKLSLSRHFLGPEDA